MRRSELRLVLVLVLALAAAPLSLVAADEHEPDETTARFYMRNNGPDCGNGSNPFLHREAGTADANCGYINGLPFGELYTHTPLGNNVKTYSISGLTDVIDAERDLTGNIAVLSSSQSERMAVGQVRVDVTVRARINNKNVTVGTFSDEQLVDPSNSDDINFPFSIAIPEAHHGGTLTNLHADVEIRGWHALTGYHWLNGRSFLDVPVLLPEDDPEE